MQILRNSAARKQIANLSSAISMRIANLDSTKLKNRPMIVLTTPIQKNIRKNLSILENSIKRILHILKNIKKIRRNNIRNLMNLFQKSTKLKNQIILILMDKVLKDRIRRNTNLTTKRFLIIRRWPKAALRIVLEKILPIEIMMQRRILMKVYQ